MKLIKPEPYHYDKGRSLAPEEIAQVAEEVTPLEEIRVRTCKLLGKGDRHRGTVRD